MNGWYRVRLEQISFIHLVKIFLAETEPDC
jgi:hypothetical protein